MSGSPASYNKLCVTGLGLSLADTEVEYFKLTFQIHDLVENLRENHGIDEMALDLDSLFSFFVRSILENDQLPSLFTQRVEVSTCNLLLRLVAVKSEPGGQRRNDSTYIVLFAAFVYAFLAFAVSSAILPA